MSKITDYILEREERGELEFDAITRTYEPTKGVARVNTRKLTNDRLMTLEEHLEFAHDYMKTEQFAKEWDKFCETGKF